MIKPTVGRVVWFFPGEADKKQYGEGPWAALVTKVHSDRMVNLAVFSPSGTQMYQNSVILVQENEECPSYAYCCWMPYQQGQAAKAEALEKKLAEKS